MRICNCGSCQSASERASGLIKKMLADNECPVYAFAVSEAMQMFSSYLLMEMTAAQTGLPQAIALVVNNDTEESLRLRMVGYMKDHSKAYTDILTELCLAYNDLVDRSVADAKARKEDLANIKTPKGD